MSVATILQRKGTHVDTVSPEIPLAAVARRMVAQGVGSLVVQHEGSGRILGVLTERDLVRSVAEHGADSLEFPASRVLTQRLTRCAKDDSLRKVMSLMTERRVRHLPVIEGDAMLGIVSIGDVVKLRLEEIELEVGVLRDYARARV